jgi:hypothetical protein
MIATWGKNPVGIGNGKPEGTDVNNEITHGRRYHPD